MQSLWSGPGISLDGTYECVCSGPTQRVFPSTNVMLILKICPEKFMEKAAIGINWFTSVWQLSRFFFLNSENILADGNKFGNTCLETWCCQHVSDVTPPSPLFGRYVTAAAFRRSLWFTINIPTMSEQRWTGQEEHRNLTLPFPVVSKPANYLTTEWC